MKLNRIFTFANVVFLILIFNACNKPQNTQIEKIVETAKPVEITKAKLGEIRSELDLSGTIRGNSHVSVFTKIAGKVIELRVDSADEIRKGDVIAVIEHDELKLNVHQAEAAHNAAKANFDQSRKLAKIRIEAQVTQAEAQLNAAEASFSQVLDLAQTRTLSQIEQAEAGLASLQANLEKIKSGARKEDRRRAKSAVDQANANLENAKSNYDRMKSLFDNGAISVQSFEGAKTQLDIAQAQHDMAIEQQNLIEKGAQDEDIRAMESQVKQAEAMLKLARRSSETKSWEKDLELAKSQVEIAKANVKTTSALLSAKSWEAEIIGAETAMIQAKTALDLAKKMLSDATITAPISGTISRRNVELGSMASPQMPICDIVDMRNVKAIVNVIESDLSKIELGRTAEISVDAIENSVFGEISLISPTLDVMSRSVTVEITIVNTDRKLKPGMFAKVKIPVEIRTDTITIPRSAVVEDREKNTKFVFVIANDKSEKRSVEFGLTRGSVVEIVSGLNADEQIVTAGQHSLKNGENVRIVTP